MLKLALLCFLVSCKPRLSQKQAASPAPESPKSHCFLYAVDTTEQMFYALQADQATLCEEQKLDLAGSSEAIAYLRQIIPSTQAHYVHFFMKDMFNRFQAIAKDEESATEEILKLKPLNTSEKASKYKGVAAKRYKDYSTSRYSILSLEHQGVNYVVVVHQKDLQIEFEIFTEENFTKLDKFSEGKSIIFQEGPLLIFKSSLPLALKDIGFEKWIADRFNINKKMPALVVLDSPASQAFASKIPEPPPAPAVTSDIKIDENPIASDASHGPPRRKPAPRSMIPAFLRAMPAKDGWELIGVESISAEQLQSLPKYQGLEIDAVFLGWVNKQLKVVVSYTPIRSEPPKPEELTPAAKPSP